MASSLHEPIACVGSKYPSVKNFWYTVYIGIFFFQPLLLPSSSLFAIFQKYFNFAFIKQNAFVGEYFQNKLDIQSYHLAIVTTMQNNMKKDQT